MASTSAYYSPAIVEPGLRRLSTDVCVYGANAAGVMAAVQVARSGRKVVLLNPSRHVGGMTTGGLSFTDLGDKSAIGGLAREFYRRTGAHYGKQEEWNFEPHVAGRVLNAFLGESGVAVMNGQYVESVRRAESSGAPRIAEMTTTGGAAVAAGYFMDCSYEGDLMARSGVSCVIGREANAEHGERFNGQQIRATHQFDSRIDPYIRPGDPQSGLLPGIDRDGRFVPGSPDRRVQAYNFRVCLTRQPGLRVSFSKPDGFDRGDHELLVRLLASGWSNVFAKFDRIQGGKTDTNNFGPVSTDYIGGSHAWPQASYAVREGIFQEHVRYQQGYHWFMGNDPSVPVQIRSAYAKWGLAADEFLGTADHWPHQLYVREARRMVGEQVVTEHHCLGLTAVDDPIGLGAYQMDSHNCRRIVQDGRVLNEGDVEIGLSRPYGIGYRSIVPRKGECANLLVPVCLSATHIAWGSIRMEPVFMILAQSAAIAACSAIASGNIPVQDVQYGTIRPLLDECGQKLSTDGIGGAPAGNESPVPAPGV